MEENRIIAGVLIVGILATNLKEMCIRDRAWVNPPEEEKVAPEKTEDNK